MEISKIIELNSKVTEIKYLDSILNPIGELDSISINIMPPGCKYADDIQYKAIPLAHFEEPIKQLIRERIEQLNKEIEQA